MIIYAKSWNICNNSGELVGALYYDTETKRATASIYKHELNTEELKELAKAAEMVERRTAMFTEALEGSLS